MDDFGRHGHCWREAGVEVTDLETVITDLLDGQYKVGWRVANDAVEDCIFDMRWWIALTLGEENE